MEINNPRIFEKINFSDFDVLETNLDKPSKTITFVISGGWYFDAGQRCKLGKGYLKIENYISLIITSYNAKRDVEEVLDEDNFEHLQEICELDVAQNNLVVKGFAKTTFNWVEFNLIGGIVTGEFLNSPEDE